MVFVYLTNTYDMWVCRYSVCYDVASFQSSQSLYSTEFCKMFIRCFLIAVVSTAIASPVAEGSLGLTDLSKVFSVNGFSPSAERPNDYIPQVVTDNDEALAWQDPARNVISAAAFPENPIEYSTNFVIASTGHPVEKDVQDLVDPGERFRNFDCNDSNGVCCMGNPLASHRDAQHCEQSIQPCSNPFYNAQLMLYTRRNHS